jgi:hypothetical protein
MQSQEDKTIAILLLTRNKTVEGHQWLTPVILATWETEFRRMAFQG